MSVKQMIKQMADGRINRTGIQASPKDSAKTIEGAAQGQPTSPGDGFAIAELRREYAMQAEPIGSMPPPGTLKGAAKSALAAMSGNRALFLLDKIAERMAFERTGVRLYDEVLVALDTHGSFPGGPARTDLERIQADEAAHFLILKLAVEELGGDPTAMTPSAALTAVESMGLMQALGEPRRTLPEALHAILIAELVDNDGWDLLITVSDEMGQTELASRARVARQNEAEHLTMVRTWLKAYASQAAKLGGPDVPESSVAPP